YSQGYDYRPCPVEEVVRSREQLAEAARALHVEGERRPVHGYPHAISFLRPYWPEFCFEKLSMELEELSILLRFASISPYLRLRSASLEASLASRSSRSRLSLPISVSMVPVFRVTMPPVST